MNLCISKIWNLRWCILTSKFLACLRFVQTCLYSILAVRLCKVKPIWAHRCKGRATKPWMLSFLGPWGRIWSLDTSCSIDREKPWTRDEDEQGSEGNMKIHVDKWYLRPKKSSLEDGRVYSLRGMLGAKDIRADSCIEHVFSECKQGIDCCAWSRHSMMGQM